MLKKPIAIPRCCGRKYAEQVNIDSDCSVPASMPCTTRAKVSTTSSGPARPPAAKRRRCTVHRRRSCAARSCRSARRSATVRWSGLRGFPWLSTARDPARCRRSHDVRQRDVDRGGGYDGRYRSQQRHYRHVHAIARPEAGEQTSVVSMGRDITTDIRLFLGVSYVRDRSLRRSGVGRPNGCRRASPVRCRAAAETTPYVIDLTRYF